MNDFEEKLGPREVVALHELTREKTPPDFLEQRIVGALRESQLIRPPWFVWQRRLVMTGGVIAAAAVLFTVGAVIGARWNAAPAVNENQSEFMLLLRNSPRELPTRSSNEALQRVREYSAWAKKMNQEGVLLDGEKLTDEGQTMNVVDGRSIVSEMEADAKKTAIAGYFLIHAHNYQQAIGIAEDCPHVKYGGTIEIRQIDSLGARSN